MVGIRLANFGRKEMKTINKSKATRPCARPQNNVFNFDRWAFAATLVRERSVFQEYICGLQT
jgi:hypothetical protein